MHVPVFAPSWSEVQGAELATTSGAVTGASGGAEAGAAGSPRARRSAVWAVGDASTM